MILRLRTRDGMFRVKTEPDSEIKTVISNLETQLKKKNVDLFHSKISINGSTFNVEDILYNKNSDFDLKHGAILTLTFEESAVIPETRPTSTVDSSFLGKDSVTSDEFSVTQFPVDDLLDKKDGIIKRKRTSLCRHSDKGMCEYCSPLPPWDSNYLNEHNIKHKSFHAYLNELNESTNKASGSSYIPPLKELSFEVAKNCTGGHKPWPQGICSKCQPSAITLQLQDFRMVDHVEMSDPQLINNFIESWRSSGSQRLGILYGTYEEYTSVPLGIKAVVHAIYEPPQADELDGITLSDWENEEHINRVANLCGLTKVGVIFTDLIDAGNGDGTVICKRHKDSYFLSSLEIMFAARGQIKNPNYTKHSKSGKFSSKFVTCVLSGNLNQEIEISSYQVSASAESLVRADLISASTHPGMVFVNEKTTNRYVPDIFFKETNRYDIVVKKNAKPAFPNDYLLVALTHGFPDNPNNFFKSNKFTVENRQYIGKFQDIGGLKNYTESKDLNIFMENLSDFHLLCFLFELEMLNTKEKKLCCDIAIKQDPRLCYELFETPGWKTVMALMTVLE